MATYEQESNVMENNETIIDFLRASLATTLMVALFPWSLLFCVVVYGFDETIAIVLAMAIGWAATIWRVIVGILTIASVILVIGLFAYIAIGSSHNQRASTQVQESSTQQSPAPRTSSSTTNPSSADHLTVATTGSENKESEDPCAPGLSRKERLRRLALKGAIRQTGEFDFVAGKSEVDIFPSGQLILCR